MDIDDALDQADFATQDEPICFKGSLIRKWEEAEMAVRVAQATFDIAVEQDVPTAQAAAERTEALAAFKAIEQEMLDASVTFTLTGVPEATWQSTLLKAPPREGNQIDAYMGYDTTKAPALFIKLCTVAPTMTDAQWEKAFDKMTDAQFHRLADAAITLNRGVDGRIPFSSAVSEVIRASGETSSQPAPSASAHEASGAGPRKAKAKASGTKSLGT